MTYGYWISRARVHLGDAVEQLANASPGSDMDLLAIATRRAAVYRQLERNVEILLRRTNFRGAPRAARRPMASLFARVRDRLHVAAADLTGMPGATSQSPAAASLTCAVDCLGVAADILASHLLPQPRTPEAVAIRLGGGVAPAMADLARAGLDAVAADRALLAWLNVGEPASAVAEATISSARRTSTGSLPSVLTEAIAAGMAGPRLLDSLSIARTTGIAGTQIETLAAAAASLREARTWLWQDANRVHAAHLRLGTELGLAVSQLAGTTADTAARGWRRAVAFADDIDGSAPIDQAADVANRLAKIVEWTRAAIQRNDTARIDDLAAGLPVLADTLLGGVRSAAARGDLFVKRATLIRGSGGVARATNVWRRATPTDDEIVGLRVALASAGSSDAVQRRQSPARVAFQRRPQPGTGSVPCVPAPSTAPRSRRGRS